MEAKPTMTKLDSEEVDFHVCDERECKNSYTPYKSYTGERFCVTHGTR